ncbi:MAG TPA: hypothetical protein VKB88_03465 [Bryobacteraceae bacterium]|nr:hypothetical protein [Bryobacteraceae bacterium]
MASEAADMQRLLDETEEAFGTTSNELQSTRSKTDHLRIST